MVAAADPLSFRRGVLSDPSSVSAQHSVSALIPPLGPVVADALA